MYVFVYKKLGEHLIEKYCTVNFTYVHVLNCIFSAIQFISCSVDPKGVLTNRIWNMSIYINITIVYKLSKFVVQL